MTDNTDPRAGHEDDDAGEREVPFPAQGGLAYMTPLTIDGTHVTLTPGIIDEGDHEQWADWLSELELHLLLATLNYASRVAERALHLKRPPKRS